MSNIITTFASLLTKIQSRLQSGKKATPKFLTYLREASIFITPDLLILPQEITFPAVGIKDGQMDFIQQTDIQDDDRDFTVMLAAYTSLTGPTEALLIGKDRANTDSRAVGVLQVLEDIITALKDYRDFDQDGMDEFASALPVTSPESALIETDKNLSLIMRSVIFKYKRFDEI